MPEGVRFLRTGRQPLVGRESALARLVDAFDAAAGGVGRVTFVTGEPGIGKTRLVEELTDVARERGACINWATCREGGGAPAFWPWVQVIRSCREHVCAPPPELGPRIEDALALVDQSTSADDPVGDQARFRLFDSMATLLTHSCAKSPLIIVLDDLHWADLPSLHFLRFLVPELRAHPIFLVGTIRDLDVEAGADAAGLLRDAMRGAPVVALGGLPRDAVEQMLTTATGGVPDDQLVDAVHQRSAGNPLFVGELARLMATRGEAGVTVDTSVPDGIRAVIERRLARLSQPCHELLGVASVLGEDFGIDVIEPVTGRDRPSVLDLLDEAVRTRLVAPTDQPGFRFRFSHALIRDAVYESLPLTRRVDVHDRAASVLESLGAADDDRVAELAFHALHAAPGGNVLRAVEACERAGRQALEKLAYEQAAHHFHTALDALELSGSEPDRRTSLLLDLGESLMGSGDVPTARVAFGGAADLARSRGRPADLARAALGFAAGLGGFEVRLFDESQITMLEEALAVLPEADSELRARVLARLSVAVSFVETREQRRDLSAAAVEMARRVGDPVVLAHALAAHCDGIAGPDHVEERRSATTEIVALAIAARDPATELLGRRMRLVTLLELGDLFAASAEIDAFARTADTLRQPVYSWYVPLWRGYLALAEGRLDDALLWNAEAEDIGSRAHSVNAEMLTATQRVAVHLRREDYGAAVELQDRVVALVGDIGVEGAAYLAAVRVLAGDPAPWHRLDHPSVVDAVDLGAEWLVGMCFLGLAAMRAGPVETADVVYRRLRPYAHLFVVDGIGAAPYGSVSQWLADLAAFLGREDQPAESAESVSRVNTFRREGDVWVLVYAGKKAQLRDLKGLHDLVTLLAAPGKEIAAVDLAQTRGATEPAEGLHGPGDAGPVLDGRTRREYEARIRELQAEVEEAEDHRDLERAAKAEVELDALVAQLASAVGLGGRARKVGDPAEKARTAVTWRIRNAIERIGQAHPTLGRHLRKSVRTGTFCAYDPEKPVHWVT